VGGKNSRKKGGRGENSACDQNAINRERGEACSTERIKKKGLYDAKKRRIFLQNAKGKGGRKIHHRNPRGKEKIPPSEKKREKKAISYLEKGYFGEGRKGSILGEKANSKVRKNKRKGTLE